jgi:hypothetical protein
MNFEINNTLIANISYAGHNLRGLRGYSVEVDQVNTALLDRSFRLK